MKDTKKENKPKILADREDSVIVVIDIQKRLLPVIHEGEKVVQNTGKFLQAAKILDIPVILTEQVKLGKTVSELTSLPSPIRKQSFDCFLNKEFKERIEGLNRNTIFLVGIEAHICVAQTALHALGEYKVHLIADAVSSRKERDAKLGIERCCQEGATVTSSEMAIYELLERAGTKEFKKVLPIVK